MDRLDIEARLQTGYDTAKSENATETKPFGQTSEELYPYTYWFVKGYNAFVEGKPSP